MKIFNNLDEWRAFRKSDCFMHKTIGFVPTMGNLHRGHQSLLTRSKNENDFTVLSIFVNPTQFNDPTDFKKYPKTFDADVAIAEESGVDFILYPAYENLYPDHYFYRVQEIEFSKILCGKYREGHFDGMLTVVMKLLNLVQATRAYFGEKDYQQLRLVKGMVEAFFMEVEIVPCQTVRDVKGLALSSRNNLLTNAQKELAQHFSVLLNSNNTCEEIAEKLQQIRFHVEYIEEHQGRRFGAVYLGNVRLIDNVDIT